MGGQAYPWESGTGAAVFGAFKTLRLAAIGAIRGAIGSASRPSLRCASYAGATEAGFLRLAVMPRDQPSPVAAPARPAEA